MSQEDWESTKKAFKSLHEAQDEEPKTTENSEPLKIKFEFSNISNYVWLHAKGTNYNNIKTVDTTNFFGFKKSIAKLRYDILLARERMVAEYDMLENLQAGHEYLVNGGAP